MVYNIYQRFAFPNLYLMCMIPMQMRKVDLGCKLSAQSAGMVWLQHFAGVVIILLSVSDCIMVHGEVKSYYDRISM